MSKSNKGITTQPDVYNDKFKSVMKEFDDELLAAAGKNGVLYTVTNLQQAFCIARNMAEHAERKYMQHTQSSINTGKFFASNFSPTAAVLRFSISFLAFSIENIHHTPYTNGSRDLQTQSGHVALA
ncbi:hypothetical protein HKX48_007589 [Thoreauomyces humboldtii]|nr:hypothetical protein HKX48_007589 [Thoreauomyces humboldtii]